MMKNTIRAIDQIEELSVSECIHQRRSVKWYDPEHVMSESEFDYIMKHALMSPTAFNLQNWRFVRVKDKKIRQAIREVSFDQAQVTDASELIILCFDTQCWQKDPNRYWKDAPDDIREYIVSAMDGYYRGREQVQRDEGMRSCGIAIMNIMILAKSMGYDSCPMDGFDYEKVAEIINLPDDHEIGLMVVIGKATKEAWPRSGQLMVEEVLVTDGF